MNIGRTTVLVLAAAIIPGGVILLIPAIYRRSMEAARELGVAIPAFRDGLRFPAAGRLLVRKYLARSHAGSEG